MSKGAKIALAVCALVVVGVATLIVVNQARARQRQETYSNAYALFKEGKFEEAAELYANLKDETWLEKCDLGVAERDAQALYDGGEPDEALALLRERAPDGELRSKLAEDYAAALIESEKYEEALAVLQADAPESETVAYCEAVVAQVAQEQTFQAQAVEGDWHAASASLEKIEAANSETRRLSDTALDALRHVAEGDYGAWCVADGLVRSADSEYVARTVAAVMAANGHYSNAISDYEKLGDKDGIRAVLDAMVAEGVRGVDLFMAYQALGDADGMRSEAEWMLASGEYERAYKAYEVLDDTDGKRAVIDAEAAAGRLAQALDKAVATSDYEQADAVLARVPTDGSLLSESASTSPLVCADALSTLAERGDDAALALAARIVDKVAGECRASIAQEKRCVPYYALGKVKDSAGALWTDELQALMDSCVEPMPEESFVVRDHGALARAGDPGGTATIHVYNESHRGLILCLMSKPDFSKSIFVYVTPGMYDFTVKAGSYDGSVWKGDLWFGDGEGFGPQYTTTDVQVVDGLTGIRQDDYLEGSFSITVE